VSGKRVLLDENLPHKLRFAFPGHEAVTAVYAGFGGYKNGALLRAPKTPVSMSWSLAISRWNISRIWPDEGLQLFRSPRTAGRLLRTILRRLLWL
jgi:hypothetical protein